MEWGTTLRSGGVVQTTAGGARGLARWLALAALCAFGTACGGAEIEGELRPPQELRPRGIVIMPVALLQEGATALDVAARSTDVANWLLTNTDLPIVGPLDFQTTVALDEAKLLHRDTDAFDRKEAFGTDFADWVTLHVQVTENRAVNVRDIVDERKKSEGGTGKTLRKHGVEAALHVEVTLFDAMRGRRLAFTMADTTDDPADVPSLGDPRPGLARAIGKALIRLQTIAGPQLQGPGGRRHRGEWLGPSVSALMDYKIGDLPPAQEKYAALADADRDIYLFSLWDRFAPNTATGDIKAATKHPGLLVQRATPPFEVGDIVQAVGPTPMQVPWQFDRELRRCSDAGCQVKVWRKNAEQTLVVRWPSLPPAPIPEQEEP